MNLQGEINVKPYLIILTTCLILSSCAMPQPARHFTSQEIAKRLLDSTVYLKIAKKRKNTYQYYYGSGFVVRPGYVATNHHVASRMVLKLSSVRLVNSKRELPITQIAATHTDYDLAILRCPRVKAVPLGLGNSDTIQIGDTVYVSGNPRGYAGTFSAGVVSALRNNAFKADDDMIQITAPIAPGSSGGPVMNAHGQVIGVIRSTDPSGQNINFAAPINVLKFMMQEL